jgi:hypothetical protein
MVTNKQVLRAIRVLDEARKTSIFLGEINGTQHWVHPKPGQDHSTPAFQSKVKKQQAAFKDLKSKAKAPVVRAKNPDKSGK